MFVGLWLAAHAPDEQKCTTLGRSISWPDLKSCAFLQTFLLYARQPEHLSVSWKALRNGYEFVKRFPDLSCAATIQDIAHNPLSGDWSLKCLNEGCLPWLRHIELPRELRPIMDPHYQPDSPILSTHVLDLYLFALDAWRCHHISSITAAVAVPQPHDLSDHRSPCGSREWWAMIKQHVVCLYDIPQMWWAWMHQQLENRYSRGVLRDIARFAALSSGGGPGATLLLAMWSLWIIQVASQVASQLPKPQVSGTTVVFVDTEEQSPLGAKRARKEKSDIVVDAIAWQFDDWTLTQISILRGKLRRLSPCIIMPLDWDGVIDHTLHELTSHLSSSISVSRAVLTEHSSRGHQRELSFVPFQKWKAQDNHKPIARIVKKDEAAEVKEASYPMKLPGWLMVSDTSGQPHEQQLPWRVSTHVLDILPIIHSQPPSSLEWWLRTIPPHKLVSSSSSSSSAPAPLPRTLPTKQHSIHSRSAVAMALEASIASESASKPKRRRRSTAEDQLITAAGEVQPARLASKRTSPLWQHIDPQLTWISLHLLNGFRVYHGLASNHIALVNNTSGDSRTQMLHVPSIARSEDNYRLVRQDPQVAGLRDVYLNLSEVGVHTLPELQQHGDLQLETVLPLFAMELIGLVAFQLKALHVVLCSKRLPHQQVLHAGSCVDQGGLKGSGNTPLQLETRDAMGQRVLRFLSSLPAERRPIYVCSQSYSLSPPFVLRTLPPKTQLLVDDFGALLSPWVMPDLVPFARADGRNRITQAASADVRLQQTYLPELVPGAHSLTGDLLRILYGRGKQLWFLDCHQPRGLFYDSLSCAIELDRLLSQWVQNPSSTILRSLVLYQLQYGMKTLLFPDE